jgi:hypothetical protein
MSKYNASIEYLQELNSCGILAYGQSMLPTIMNVHFMRWLASFCTYGNKWGNFFYINDMCVEESE